MYITDHIIFLFTQEKHMKFNEITSMKPKRSTSILLKLSILENCAGLETTHYPGMDKKKKPFQQKKKKHNIFSHCF